MNIRAFTVLALTALSLPLSTFAGTCSGNLCDGVVYSLTSQVSDGVVMITMDGDEPSLTACNGVNFAIALKPTHPRFSEIYSGLLEAAALRTRVTLYVKNTPGQPCEAADVGFYFN